MASVGENLKEYLKTKVAITGRVGSGDNARIYLEYPKQGAVQPFIVIETFEGLSNEYLSGITGIARNRVQITAFDESSADAYTLAEAIRLAPLQMFRGTIGDTFANSIKSDTSYRSGYDPPTAGANNQRFWYSRDYFVTYEEPKTGA